MVAVLCVLVLAGFPVAFTLAGCAVAFAGLGIALGVFDPAFLGFVPNRIYGVMTNEVLVAVPLFVFMGVTLERSRVAEDLLETMGQLFGRVRGGLGIAVCVVGALLAASTGIVGATVVTMGLLSLPVMLRRGYDPALASGTIAAAGTLGQIIPPSIVLVVLGDQISTAHQEAQRALGNFAPEPVSVGDLFAGAMVPGLVLVVLYVTYLATLAWLRPGSAPPIDRDPRAPAAIGPRLARALVAPLVLVIAVLGSILAGAATPTEAAGLGAAGAILLAGARVAPGAARPVGLAALALAGMLALARTFDLRLARDHLASGEVVAIGVALVLGVVLAGGIVWSLVRLRAVGVLGPIVGATARLTAMVFVVVIGAQLFSLVFRGFGGDETVERILGHVPGGVVGAMLAVMALVFVLGFFLEFIEITYIVVPIVGPVLLALGVDPIWLGVMIAMNLQTSFLTPPFGFALFYLRGVAPPEVTTAAIYRGIVPFVLIQLAMLALLAAFPGMATWLPSVLFG
ncbi:MAG: TRAP transporter large permease subunit [Ectothiorhodospiraceae bacterium]|nr:TRAP transporter large permease subunit [Chromatiales bacterium]MCP5154578.1 TRAP transporter large permease subunit [Ectothiorhodospiraceae bacterium]